MGKTKHGGTSGKVGDLIFYEYRGKPCCRSTPGEIKQTAATKACASQFGLAVRISRAFRRYLEPILPDEKDKRMLYSFNNALLQWLRHTKPNENTFSAVNFFIDQFQFNEAALLPAIVKLPVTATFPQPGTILVKIPELMPGRDMAAPPGTKKIYWNIRVINGVIDFAYPWCSPSEVIAHQIELTYTDAPLPAQEFLLPFECIKSALTIVGISLMYEIEEMGEMQIVADKRWMPAGIIGSCFGVHPSA